MELRMLEAEFLHGVGVVRGEGRIIWGPECDAFRSLAEEALSRSSDLVLNLTAVRNVDNHGIGVLIALLLKARSLGGDTRLVLRGGKVEQILRLMRLYEQFRVYGDESTAVDSFCAVAA
jgi:anti-anti-sigma factor